MGINAKRARRALRAAGLGSFSLCGLLWPIGRQKRLLALLRERRAALEAKGNIVGFLVRTQGALSDLGLGRLEQVQVALRDPEKKRLILAVGASRPMLEEELSARDGSEVGRALERALSELVAGGVILRVPAKEALGTNDVYVVVHGRKRPQYDLREIDQLLREGREYGSELRARERREQTTGGSRTYRM